MVSVGKTGFIKQGAEDVLALVTKVEKDIVHVTAFPAGYTPHPAKVAAADFHDGPSEGPPAGGSSPAEEKPT